MNVDPQLVAAIADALARGQIPGFGAAQNDTWPFNDNVDNAHPANIRYVIPSNCQRLVAARLSFHLAPFRQYSKAAAQAAHRHLMFQDAGASQQANAFPVNIREYNCFFNGGIAAMFGVQVTTGPLVVADLYTYDTQQPAVTLTSGVFEDTTASGVTVSFDGIDKTSALGGPFSADQVELDVLPYVQQKPDKKYHVLTLTPAGNGRIEAHLRLSYFANAGINA